MAPQFPHLHSTVGLSASSTGGALGSASMTSGAATILNVFCRRAGIAANQFSSYSELNITSFGQLTINFSEPATRFQRTSAMRVVGFPTQQPKARLGVQSVACRPTPEPIFPCIVLVLGSGAGRQAL
jgi:hypothetical protein